MVFKFCIRFAVICFFLTLGCYLNSCSYSDSSTETISKDGKIEKDEKEDSIQVDPALYQEIEEMMLIPKSRYRKLVGCGNYL